MRALWGGLLCLPLSLLPSVLVAPPTSAAVRPCSSGLVALTFDDGPDGGPTDELLRILEKRKVPATFFSFYMFRVFTSRGDMLATLAGLPPEMGWRPWTA